MHKIAIRTLNTPLGELRAGDFQGNLCLLDWKYRPSREAVDKRVCIALGAEFEEGDSKLLTEVENQMQDYFRGLRKEFDLPIMPLGSPFQLRVWEAIRALSYGETASYLHLSRSLGNEKALRAVAAANGANALAIIIPCHRIIGSDGSLTGYAGGLEAKRALLQLESAKIISNQPTLFD